MASIKELEASLQKDGVDTSNIIQQNQPISKPSFTEELVTSGANLIEKIVDSPSESVASATQGVINSFNPPEKILGVPTGFKDRLIERISGSINFPFVRGAEIADGIWNGNLLKKEFKSLKDVQADRILYSKYLESKNPELTQGMEIGSFVASLKSLGQDGVKLYNYIKDSPEIASVIPKFYQKLLRMVPEGVTKIGKNTKDAVLSKIPGKVIDATGNPSLIQSKSDQLKNKAINFSEETMDLSAGEVQKAMIERPLEVKKAMKEDGNLVNDLALKISEKLKNVHTHLSNEVAIQKTNFVADPTKRVNVTKPVEVFDSLKNQKVMLDSPLNLLRKFKDSVTDPDTGLIKLDKRSLVELKDIEDTLTGVNKIGGNFDGTLAPQSAMLLLKKLDGLIDWDKLNLPGADPILKEYQLGLAMLRKSLKHQIRGNNDKWFIADENFSNFRELRVPFENSLKEIKSEGLVSNLFSKNKTEFRKQFIELIDFSDLVDKTNGSGDAFLNRLANIKAAETIQGAKKGITRPLQETTNQIVRNYRNTGALLGAAAGYLKLGSVDSAAIGSAIGAYALGKVGQKMANPERVLNMALASQGLSSKAKQLALDLKFIHKNYGNDGVISFLDVIGPIPAVNELTDFSNRLSTNGGERKVDGYLSNSNKQLENLQRAK